MKKKLLPAAGLVLAAASYQASAQMFYEPFDYGSSTTSGTNSQFSNQPTSVSPNFKGYTNPSSGLAWFEDFNTAAPANLANVLGNDNAIFSGNMAAPSGLSAPVGNSAGNTVQNNPQSATNMQPNAFASAGTTVYHSLLFTINDMSNTSTSSLGGGLVYGLAFTPGGAGFFTGTYGTVGAALQVRHDQGPAGNGVGADSTKFNVGLRAGNQTFWDNTDRFATGTSVFLVFGYQIVNGGSSDVQSLWVNPSSSSFGTVTPPTPAVTETGANVSAGAFASGLDAIFFGRGANNALQPKGMQFDEVRADTSWAQVTPPTGTTLTTGGGGNWTTATWSAGAPNAAAAFAYFTNPAGDSVVVDAPQTVGTLTIRSAGGYTISGSSALTLNSGGTAGSAINVQPQMDPTGPAMALVGSHTISAPLILASATEANVGVNQTLTLSGNISESGSQMLTKNGAGKLLLQGVNSYTGGTLVNDGVLAINSDSALGTAPGSAATNLTIQSGSSTLRFDADMTLGATRNITLANASGNSPSINTNNHLVTIAGQISGAPGGASIVKDGLGTLVLTGDNSGTGGGGSVVGLSVNTGTVNVLNDAAIGKVPITVGANNIILGSTLSGSTGTLQWGSSFDINGNRNINVTFGGVLDTNGFSTPGGYSGNLATNTSPGAVTKTGAGEFYMTGNAGMTTLKVTGGQYTALQDNSLGTISGSPTVVLSSGGAVGFNTDCTTVAQRSFTILAGGGTISTGGRLGSGASHNVTILGTITGAGTLTKADLGTLNVPNVRVGGLAVTGGTLHVLPSGDASTSTSSLGAAPTIAAGSKFDIDDNSVVINYSGASPLATVRTLIQTGRGPAGFGNATWNGLGGITSSKASPASQGLGGIGSGVDPAIGYGENSGMPIATFTAFNGQTVNSSSILIKYTRGADATLDGVVDNSDVTVVGTEFNNPNSGQWYLGDFDYSGTCDNSDVTALGTLFNPTAPPLSPAQLNAEFGSAFAQAFAAGQASAAVPEPTSMVLLGLGGLGLLGRRRRAK